MKLVEKEKQTIRVHQRDNWKSK